LVFPNDRPLWGSARRCLLFIPFLLAATFITIAAATAQVDPGYAWWLTVRFTPTSQKIASIPIRRIDPEWSRAEALTRKLLPPEASSDPSSLENPAFGFSREGDFDGDGLRDKALVGVYRTRSGKMGRFLLIVTQRKPGPWQPTFLEKVPGDPGFSILWSDGRVLRWYQCMECDSYGVLVRTKEGYRVDWQSCCGNS
jgi:hypothetical protein